MCVLPDHVTYQVREIGDLGKSLTDDKLECDGGKEEDKGEL